jgi:crotonobetainyl-CoA:carnitine CoA-transferase CaiB-like acyl-CoA transferase
LGYGFLVQGMSGMMSLTGEPKRQPQKIAVAFVDIFSDLCGVIGSQAALAERARSGLDQHVDISLLDSMTVVWANQLMNFFISSKAPTRLANAHPNIVPYKVFVVADAMSSSPAEMTDSLHRFARFWGQKISLATLPLRPIQIGLKTARR